MDLKSLEVSKNIIAIDSVDGWMVPTIFKTKTVEKTSKHMDGRFANNKYIKYVLYYYNSCV